MGYFAVEALKEAGDVDLLRAKALACGGDDFLIQTEARGGLNAGGCAGDAELKLEVWRQS